MIGRAFYFSRAAKRDLPLPDRSELDLLHLDNLYAIGRTGLRHALVSLFAIAIGGLILLDTEFGGHRYYSLRSSSKSAYGH